MRSKTNVVRKVLPAGQILSSITQPDAISNIRMVRYHMNPRQSLLRCQIEARRLRATRVWHTFWTNHNDNYMRQLEALQARFPDQEVPIDEMSRFYRENLMATRKDHKEFNAWWIKENFGLLYAGIKCWFWERLPAKKEPGFFGGH